MELEFSRSRRRSLSRRNRPLRRGPAGWRSVHAVVLALVLLAVAAESTRLENSNANPPRARPIAASEVARSCGIPQRFGAAFAAAASRTGLPLSLLAATAYEESRMNPGARSRAGATGLLQLMPATARLLRVEGDEPAANVLAGARYLRQLLDRFGSIELALAAYNAGPTAVAKAGAAPTLATLRYVKNVETRATSLAGC
jgi:soluble lytic murein transglycosylase-like protein